MAYENVYPTIGTPLGVKFWISNQSTDPSVSTPMTGDPYVGPVSGLNDEIILLSTANLNVSANVANVFIHTGSGEDALNVSAFSGNNVLDGGTGSNFLVGGTGNDTFFVDDRQPPADIWSTVKNFHAGDTATVWGVTPQDFHLNWVNNEGAIDAKGLTLHATSQGPNTTNEASLTLAGLTTADLNHMSVGFGRTGDLPGLPGSAFMTITNH